MCTLYENIINLCKARGITGGKMCTDIGISKSTLTDLKAGRKKTLTISTARKIADYFDVPMSELTGNPPMVIGMDGPSVFPAVMELFSDKKEKPADQKASGLHATDYDKLTPENKRTIDALIEQLLKAQSVD